MSLAEIKDQVVAMSKVEREELLSLILDLRDGQDIEWYAKLAAKIDNRHSGNWVSLEDFSQELDEEEGK
jgi:hypothetical protein